MNAIRTDTAPAAIGPYSQGTKDGAWVFASGQLPIDPATGTLCDADIATAARQSLANLKAVLEAGGAGLGTVVKTTVFLRDMGDFKAFNEVYAECFTPPYPARSCIQVAALPRGARVEIEAIAARKQG